MGNDRRLLAGQKVRLTAITKDDLPLFVEWFGNIELRRYLGGVTMPVRLEEEESWYEQQRKSSDVHNFAIRTLDENQLIGSCGIMDIRWHARNCEVGISVGDKDFWGKGYGTDAMRVLIHYAFMEMNMHRVGLEVLSFNPRAIKSYEKVGFQLEATSRESHYLDGKRYDDYFMSILYPEWKKLYGEGN
jgi:RimJ/RimL family protein N-acetyltransferase